MRAFCDDFQALNKENKIYILIDDLQQCVV